MVDLIKEKSIPSMPSKKKAIKVETRYFYEDDEFIIVFSKITGVKKIKDNVLEVFSHSTTFRFTNVKRIEKFLYQYLTYLNDNSIKRKIYDN